MWAFRNFPDKMEHKPEGGPACQVEVFGYLDPGGGPSQVQVRLVAFRETTFWIEDIPEIGEICLLPIKEFVAKFKNFKLTEEKNA